MAAMTHHAAQELEKKLLSDESAAFEAITLANTCPAAISIPDDFQISEVDIKFCPKTRLSTVASAPAPLGILTNLTGEFAGTGFNQIFRPNNKPTMTKFHNPVHPAPPNPPSENVLELNLTTETMTFSKPLGSIPNRGLKDQGDIFLNGVSYVQAVKDVTNHCTGRADGKATAIHFETGLWMHVPETAIDPKVPESLVRMASIPHGATINAECLEPTSSIQGPPTFPKVDITPFSEAPKTKHRFISQTASNKDTPRIPQNLEKFIAEGTITQATLDDPNIVLRNENVGKNITKTITFTVATNPPHPELGGGVANIAFLRGENKPNANAAHVKATFWIETVEYEIQVPPVKFGQKTLRISPSPPHAGALVPVFEVYVPEYIMEPQTIVVESTQIQYSQTVFLDFAGLTWPHVSVATLIPHAPVKVPASAFD